MKWEDGFAARGTILSAPPNNVLTSPCDPDRGMCAAWLRPASKQQLKWFADVDQLINSLWNQQALRGQRPDRRGCFAYSIACPLGLVFFFAFFSLKDAPYKVGVYNHSIFSYWGSYLQAHFLSHALPSYPKYIFHLAFSFLVCFLSLLLLFFSSLVYCNILYTHSLST